MRGISFLTFAKVSVSVSCFEKMPLAANAVRHSGLTSYFVGSSHVVSQQVAGAWRVRSIVVRRVAMPLRQAKQGRPFNGMHTTQDCLLLLTMPSFPNPCSRIWSRNADSQMQKIASLALFFEWETSLSKKQHQCGFFGLIPFVCFPAGDTHCGQIIHTVFACLFAVFMHAKVREPLLTGRCTFGS